MSLERVPLSRLLAAIALAAILPYVSGLGNDFITWDDDVIILNQGFLREATLENIIRIASPFPAREEWLPLRDLTLLLNFALFGCEPAAFLAGNILLHATVSIALFFLLGKLGASRLAAFLGASFFACHAVHVESVTWLSARKDPLSALFLLAALLTHIRFREGSGRYAITLPFLGLALLSKASAFVFPIWAVAYDAFFQRRLTAKERLLPVLPYAVLSSAHALLYARLTSLDGVIEPYPAGGLLTVLLTDITLLKDYTLDAILPLRHQAIYAVDFVEGFRSAELAVSLLLLAGVGCLAGRFRARPWVPFAAALFYASFLPYLNLVPHGIYYAERYLYLPTIFSSLAAGKVAARLLSGVSVWRPARVAAAGTIVILLTVHAGASSRRNLVWAESIGFWRYQSKVQPENPAPLMNLGATYELYGADPSAREVYEDVLARHGEIPEALHRLARIARRAGDLQAARTLYERNARLEPGDPRSRNNLAEVHLALGEPEKAIVIYEDLVRSHPRYLLARANLARVLDGLGRPEEAGVHWRHVAEGWELLPDEPLVREAKARLEAGKAPGAAATGTRPKGDPPSSGR